MTDCPWIWQGAAPADWAKECREAPQAESFMHMHLGIDATGLGDDLLCHHLFVNSWDNIKYAPPPLPLS